MQASHGFSITILGTLCWLRWYIFGSRQLCSNYKLKFLSSLQESVLQNDFKVHHLYQPHNILILQDVPWLSITPAAHHKVQVWYQAFPYGIWGGQSGIETEFSPSTSVFLPHNSTSSLYSFVHLPVTAHNPNNWHYH